MPLKFWFKSFNLLHIWFSVFLSCSCFFFFFLKFIFLGNLPSFYFYFFNAFFNFFFLSFVKIIDFYWFLFINTCFIMNTFIMLRIFPQLFYFFFFFFFFVLAGFKNDVKGTFQFRSSPFRRIIISGKTFE